MNKSFNKIFEIYVFAYAFFFASRPLSDADFWFHLRTGEYIIRTGLFPRTDLFSFTYFGQPWIAHGWLSGTIFYLLYSRFGPYSLILLFALLAAVAFWIAFRRSDSHPLIRGFATLLGVWTALPTLGVRPRVFSLLLTSIFLALLINYTRRGGRSIWWLVPMMALWANLHGGFFIGLALIALTMVGMVVDAWASGEKVRSIWVRLWVMGLVFLVCLLAALVNPYGIAIYTFPLSVLRSPIFQDLVVDWMSPNFHQPELRPFMILMLLTIAALALSPKKVKPSELLFFLATVYATLKSQRHTATFALVAAPLFADYVQNWLNSTTFGKSMAARLTTTRQRLPQLISVLFLLPLVIFAVKLKNTVYIAPNQELMKVPIKAVQFLRENSIAGNTFTYPNIWGGYVIWELPSNPVFIDGRDVYPAQFVQQYVGMVNGLIDWRVPFERYRVQIVIVDQDSFLARQLAESPAWERVYDDEMSTVFKRL